MLSTEILYELPIPLLNFEDPRNICNAGLTSSCHREVVSPCPSHKLEGKLSGSDNSV
jgi:hypothetical protein